MHADLEIKHPKVITYAILIGQGLAHSTRDKFRYVQKDFENAMKLIELEHKDILNFQLLTNRIVLNENSEKLEILKQIGTIIEKAVADEAQRVIIYYSGYARSNGNWCLSSESAVAAEGAFEIQLEDIYTTLAEEEYSKELKLILDCSYAGKWCHDAAEIAKAGGTQSVFEQAMGYLMSREEEPV